MLWCSHLNLPRKPWPFNTEAQPRAQCVINVGAFELAGAIQIKKFTFYLALRGKSSDDCQYRESQRCFITASPSCIASFRLDFLLDRNIGSIHYPCILVSVLIIVFPKGCHFAVMNTSK